jgi:tryptophan synthase alpha chain
MSPRERISAALRPGPRNGPALVAFLTAGHPRRDTFLRDLKAVAAAADVVEIGVPFTDPMADGVTIQRSSLQALAQGVSLRWILAQLASLPRSEQLPPLLLMSYLNPLLAYGFDKLAAEGQACGICGLIVPDLPLDESEELRAALEPAGLALVQMVTPVTEPQRMKRLCEGSQGFIYAVTMTGTTGRSVAVPDDVIAYLDRVRSLASVPVCAGFGIRSREQVQRLAGHVDGVIVGSALVEVLEQGADPAAWLTALRV